MVTFTNAAASEMREKILKALYKIIDDEEIKDEQILAHIQKQINLINKAEICTIDSFCLNLVRNNFFEINISPNFKIADNAECELLKQEAIDKIFEEKYEQNDEDFEELIKTYTSYKDDTNLKEIILKIYTYIGSNPFPFKWLNDQIEKFNILNLDQDFYKTQWGEILLCEMSENLEDGLRNLPAVKKELVLEEELLPCLETINSDISQLETLQANLENWDKAFNLVNGVQFTKWPTLKKVDNIKKEKAKEIRDQVKKEFGNKKDKIFCFTSKEANIDMQNMHQKLIKLKAIIQEFDEEYAKLKKEKNIVDFSDIEHFALKILIKEENGNYIQTEIAKKYQEKFVEIAIDEYQDSNLLQEYILTSISNGNNIFMVGDVKQSIYKFRQAMPDLFLEKYETYKLKTEENTATTTGTKIQLFKNFRSRQNILGFTNYIFENIMSKALGDINYTKEEYLNLGANFESLEQNYLTEINIIETEQKNEELISEEEEEEKVEDIELEARFVAKKIRELLDSNFKVFDSKKQEFRKIQPKDIVILLRSTKNKANIFEKELINNNVNVYTDVSEEYLETYEVKIIMDLLKIIDNPYQDLPLVHIMLSPIGMFTEDDLLQIRLAEKNEDFYKALLKAKLSVEDNLKEKIEVFLTKLDNWRNLSNCLDLDELIWTIYEDTGLLNYVSLMPNGEFRCANLKILFERAKQYESASFKGLFNFINFIEKVKSKNSDMGSAKLISENEDVVRIMSIHKSKGLEFPVVFLASTGSSFNMMDLNKDILLHQNCGIGAKFIDYERQIKYDTLSKKAIREKVLKENLAEEMRILYVALTRAKEKLYISAVLKDFEKQKEQMQEFIEMYKNEDEKINPILIKKYKKYIEWILLTYFYNEDSAKKLMELNCVYKNELSSKNDLEKDEEDILKILEENSKNITKEEILKLKANFDFEYKYKELSNIPTKDSVTNIVGNGDGSDFQNEKSRLSLESSQNIDFKKPQFIQGSAEEKITPSRRGTLIHLCMKNLDFTKNYNIQDVQNMVEDLYKRQIITLKELEAIDPNVVLKFTKTKIFEELKNAKEYHKEAPFYINVPANRVVNTSLDENVIVQGIIDLYYITNVNKLVLLDFKTDFVKFGEEETLIKRHKPQLMLYKDALEKGLNRKVDYVYIYSTGLGKEIKI